MTSRVLGLLLKLFRALVDPRANQSDLFRRERLGWRSEPTASKSARTTWATRTTQPAFSARSTSGRIAAIGPTRRPIGRTVRSTGSTRPALSARTAGSALGWHGDLVVNLCDSGHQETLFAVARYHDFAVLPAFEHGLQAVQAQISLLPFFTVTAKTRLLKNRADVFRVGDALFIGCRGELAEVEFADVHFFRGHDR